LSELIVVMSMAAVIMTLSATTVFHLLQAEGTGASALIGSATLSRLANDFRRDARAAGSAPTAVRVADDGQSLRLELAERQVVQYRGTPDRVVRLVTTRDDAGKDQPLRTETYRLPQSVIRFEVSDDRALVSMVHHRRSPPANAKSTPPTAAVTLRIDAAIARDHRFEEVTK
jgi:hypothetical protein